MKSSFKPSFLAVFALLAACSTPPSDPVYVFAVAPDENGVPGLRRVALDVRDPVTLENDHFEFTHGAQLHIHGFEPGEANVDHARSPHLALEHTEQGYVGLDRTAVFSLSVAHHFLTVRQYFADLGLPDELPRLTVHLFPRSVDAGEVKPESDNAFFATALAGFGILPENILDALPIGTNQGVIAHEFSHAVFSHKMGAYRSLLTPLDEGLADVHGAALTGDPRFIAWSIPQLADTRDLAAPRFYDEMTLFLAALDGSPYVYGSLVAAVFWSWHRLAEERGLVDSRKQMARLALEALQRWQPPSEPEPTAFQLERPFWVEARRASNERIEGDLLCAALRLHFPDAGHLPTQVCR